MTWSRAQRLWMRHYKDIISNLTYQHLLFATSAGSDNDAIKQIQDLENFVGISTPKARQEVLNRIRPDFNHGGNINLPGVDKSLKRLYSSLAEAGVDPKNLSIQVDLNYKSFKLRLIKSKIREHLKLLFLKTHWGQQSISKALDPETLRRQIGTTSFAPTDVNSKNIQTSATSTNFAHLNRERQNRGMKPIKTADDLFRHLYIQIYCRSTHTLGLIVENINYKMVAWNGGATSCAELFKPER